MKKPVTRDTKTTSTTKKRNVELEKYYKSKYFQEVRELVLQRDGYRCQCCSATSEERRLNVHHSKYDGVLYQEKEHLEYLITLCSVCHVSIHRARANMRRFKKN